VVWKSSRGFGGKSTLLAMLSHVEAVMLGAEVNILGGSGEQAERVHEVAQRFWEWQYAPRHLLEGDPSKRETALTNLGLMRVLMASQRSVRGPHPQRLRLDEVDEMEQDIFDAALGQPMTKRGIRTSIVASSTHQYADRTMSNVLAQAAELGWPVFQWCYRESMQVPGGWLDPAEVEQKRSVIPAAMWSAEYDLQDPSPSSRAILPDKVDEMFDRARGVYQGAPGELVVVEGPQPGASYATGADWAKEHDYTVVWTLRIDRKPRQLVAYKKMRRMPWPQMVSHYNERVREYQGPAAHDATGIGNVVADYLTVDAAGETLVGRHRADLFSEWIAAIEEGAVRAPFIAGAHSEYKLASMDDIYGAGHPPDSFVAGALGWRAFTVGNLVWSKSM
jgi:hypothetical protein